MAKSKSNKKLKRLPGPALPKTKAINPFSLHQNRKKFDILGQSSKGTKGLPGVSRQRAFDNRSKTLLVEYMNRNKDNVFLDKRLGQKDNDVDESQKIDLRRVDEVKKSMSKRSLYNLSDNADDLLTHGGVVLTDDNLNMAMSDEELDEDGMLDAQFVKDQHFGGLPQAPSHGNTDGNAHEDQNSGNRYKSQKERMDEIIAESKKRKLLAHNEKEAQVQRVTELDSQLSRFMTLLTGNLQTEEDKIKNKKVGPMAEYHRLMRTINCEGGGRAEATERLKSDEEVANERMMLLQRLEQERLERMKGGFEEQGPKAVARSADSLDTGLLEKFEGNPMVKYRDGQLLLLDGAGNVVTADGQQAKPKVSREEKKKKFKKQARLEKQRKEEENRLREDMGDSDEEESDDSEGQEENDDDEADIEKSGPDTTQEEEDGEEEEEEEEEEESDEEDNYSDILEEEGSGDEGSAVQERDIADEDSVEEEEILAQKSHKKISRKQIKSDTKQGNLGKKEKRRVSFSNEDAELEDSSKQMMEEAKNELPFTFNVPADYASFWSLLQERTPQQVSTILTRMVATNHPKVKHENKLKCQDIFSYILQTLHVLCSPDSSDLPCPGQHSLLSYVDALVPHLYTIMKIISPEVAARAMLLVFIEKRDEYRNKHKKRYPYLDTMIFLQVSGLLFPASDFYHPVMTPVKTFLGQLFAEAKMKDARSVVTGIYAATLLHEYIRESSRFSSELVWRLQGLVMCCCPQEALSQAAIKVAKRLAEGLKRPQQQQEAPALSCKDDVEMSFVPLQWLVHSTLPPQELMQFETQKKITTPPAKFKISIINDDTFTMSDDHRCTVLLTVLKILKDLCQDWSQLPSIREIMSPLHTLLPLLPIEKFPDELVQMKQDLETALNNLPPHPPRMRVDKGRPKPLRMLEPLIMEMKVNTPRSSFSRSDEKELKQKLIHSVKRERKAATREIKKDTVFLARQKLAETHKSDAERRRKVNLIMNDLRHQEGEHIQYQKMKPGSR